MIRGYRWIKTAPDTWMYESPPRSRCFHGQVYVRANGTASFCVPGGYWTYSTVTDRSEEHGCGERATLRLAKDEIEKHVRAKRA